MTKQNENPEKGAANAGETLNDEELNKASGGNGLWMVAGVPECPTCFEHPIMTTLSTEGNLITYNCPLCGKTITLFDQG